MARTKRREQQWLIDYWFFGEFNDRDEYQQHKSIFVRDKGWHCWKGVPREYRKRFNKRNRYHDKRELLLVVRYDDHEDNFSQWKRDAGYWWY